MARLCPLFSGSSGNSYYIGSATAGILIDAGRSAKQLGLALQENGIDISAVKAVFVTHEHSDHVQGVRVFASKYHLPVFATSGTIAAMENKNILNDKIEYEAIGEGIDMDGMTVQPFPISHDCAEGCGYIVTTSDGRKTAFVTDLGYVSSAVEKAVKGCDTVVLESNHDVAMLQSGPYPYELKRRILSQYGHLSNEASASFLADLIQSGTTRAILAHLSRENNLPEVAYQTALCTLTQKGMKQDIDFVLKVAPIQNRAGAIIY